MPREAKRKFVGLKCLEVSLVDEPANERPIAVMKRRTQENDMANKTKTVSKSTEGADDTETVQASVSTSLTSDQFTQLLDIAKSLGAVPSDEEDDGDDGDDDEPVTKGMFGKFKRELKKASLSVDQKVMSAIKAAFAAAEDTEDDDEDEPKGKKKTKKARSTKDDDDSVDEITARALDAFGTAIAKAKKFTPKRADVLKESVGKLMGLLAELTDEETVKEAFGASGLSISGERTGAPGFTQTHGTGGAGQPGNPIVAKSLEGAVDLAAIITAAVEKAVAPLKTTIEEQAAELTSIKKSRQAPTGGGDDDGKPKAVAKGSSLWGNIL